MNILENGNIWVFMALLPLVAFLYSAVGHGGASGYLALMVLFGFAPADMKPTALLLNLFVAAIAFYQYWRAGHFRARLFVVFALTSIPLAFVGGRVDADPTVYKKVLALLLVFAIVRLLKTGRGEAKNDRVARLWQGLPVGGGIGFFSGLIGIGGGILLTPVILLFRWGTIKEAAAVSALFIWVNSAAGLAGQVSTGISIAPHAFVMAGVAFMGGFLGGRLGSRKFDNRLLRYLLALVLAIACLKLFLA